MGGADEFDWSGLGKNGDVVDALQGRQDFGPIACRIYGAAGAFQAADAGIGIHSDDQDVAEGLGFFKAADVADVENVETAVGGNDFFSVRAKSAGKLRKFFQGNYF